MQVTDYLRRFELRVAQRSWPQAFETLGRLLAAFAQEDERFTAWCHTASRQELSAAFTRFAAAVSGLLLEPAAEMSPQGFRQLTRLAPELAHVFLVSGFANSDHILQELVARGTKSPENDTIFANQSDARKFLLLSSVYGDSVETLITMLRRAPQAALPSVLAALAAHVTCQEHAQRNRNQLLDSLAHAAGTQLTEGSMLDMHRAWTLCSYATSEHRHDVKKHLNQMILSWLESQDLPEQSDRPLGQKERPTILVACEVTGGGHVMSRCYEPFLEQLRRRFHVVTLVADSDLGDDSVPWCDELIRFSWSENRIGDVLKIIADAEPDILYYPCVGMRLWTIIACNLRLAPLQIASLGHPATTNSTAIDYMVGGAATSGNPECYSERLIKLKSPGNLYRLNRGQESYPREVRSKPVPIRIAVCANMLKLNADFLDACVAIADQSERSIEYCFMPNCIGLKYLVARQQVTARLSQRARFRVIPRHRCADYLQNLASCDLYFSPFPFGGENSTLDAILQGLPAVTLAAKQPHSRLDARVMQTAGLPSWLVAETSQEYIDAAVRLINHDEERVSITRYLLDTNLEERFADEHESYADDFVDTFWSIYQGSLAGTP